MGARSQTQFFWEPGFKKIYEALNSPTRAQILTAIKRFELAWQNSNADNDIPCGFDFTPYAVDEPYRFIQVRCGHDYRAIVIFPDRRSEAYWTHLFKKTGQKAPPKEIALAKSHAKACWTRLKGGNDGKS